MVKGFLDAGISWKIVTKSIKFDTDFRMLSMECSTRILGLELRSIVRGCRFITVEGSVIVSS